MKFLFIVLTISISTSSMAAIPESCSNFVKAAAHTENGRRDYIKNNPDATLIPTFPAGTTGIYMDDAIPFCEMIRRDELKNIKKISAEEIEKQVSITLEEAMDLYSSLLKN